MCCGTVVWNVLSGKVGHNCEMEKFGRLDGMC
jgi:hypothetical protein